MADYERSTRATTLGQLDGPLRAALDQRIERALLTVDREAPAFLTHSRALRRRGLFGRLMGSGDPDPEHESVVVLGGRYLLAGRSGERYGVAVLDARLDQVDIASPSERMRELAPAGDDGVSITGFATSVEGHAARGSWYFGLGAPDGERARSAITEAVRAAKAR